MKSTDSGMVMPPQLTPLPVERAAGRRPGPRTFARIDATQVTVLLSAVVTAVVGIVLRWQGLGRYVLEQDELYTVREATELWATELLPGIAARPLYFLMQHVLLGWLPQTAAGFRAPAFLFGLLGMAMTWVLARRLFGNIGALVALALLAFSPWHIYMSGMARYWSALYFLAVLFLYLLVRAVEDDDARCYGAAALTLVLGAATHPTFLFAAAGAVVGSMLISPGGQLRWPLPGRKALTFLWLPAGVVLLAAAVTLQLTGNEDAVRNWGGRGFLATLRLVPAIIEWCTPSLCVAAGLGMIFLVLTRVPTELRRWGLISLLGTLSTVGLLVGAAARTDVYADYATAGFPLAIISAGGLAHLLAQYARSRQFTVAAVTSALILSGMLTTTVSHLRDGTRFDYRPIYRRVMREAPTVPVATWPFNVAEYYAPSLQLEAVRVDTRIMDGYLAEYGDLWVVTSVRRFGIVMDEQGRLAEWLARTCQLEMTFERPRFDYRVHRVQLHRCTSSPDSRTAAPLAHVTTRGDNVYTP